MKSFYEMSVLVEQNQNEGIGNWMRGAALGASLLAPLAAPSNLLPSADAAQVQTQEDKDKFVARVIYAEGVGSTTEGRRCIAAVIKNRVGRKEFGNGRDMYAVVKKPNAFECIGDSDNTNWSRSENPDHLSSREKAIWNECLELAKNPPTVNGPSGRPIVYYHDHSVSKPSSWDNKSFTAVEEAMGVPGLTFYSILPVEKPKPVEKAHSKTYTIAKGDTLSGIAKSQLGNAGLYPKIIAVNPGINPNKLKIGQQINLP